MESGLSRCCLFQLCVRQALLALEPVEKAGCASNGN